MNSDPHESAAWRTFGMLDADEAASFDEAVRHDPELKNAYREMDCLSAAVAITATIPIQPQAGQLERLHLRLGLNAPKHTNWIGISGWAAAAALTMILVIEHRSNHGSVTAENTRIESTIPNPKNVSAIPHENPSTAEENRNKTIPPDLDNSVKSGLAVTGQEGDGKTVAKVEAKRLIQEIEVLRGKLENFQKRDRQRFEPVPGMAWPVVMKMAPPGITPNTGDALALVKEDPPITAMLGDALTAANGTSLSMSTMLPNGTTAGTLTLTNRSSIGSSGLLIPVATADPSAIPIYDAARDSGTLVVSNLPPTGATEAYNLWVKTDAGASPIYVGQLPKSSDQSAESFDFSLGSTSIVPSAFILTKDPQGGTTAPSKTNTVLQGPR